MVNIKHRRIGHQWYVVSTYHQHNIGKHGMLAAARRRHVQHNISNIIIFILQRVPASLTPASYLLRDKTIFATCMA